MCVIRKLKNLKRLYVKVFKYKDKRNLLNNHVPYLKRVRWALKGFTEQEIVGFNLTRKNHREYISYSERLRLETVNDEFWATLLGKKMVFEKFFGNVFNVAHVYWWNKKGHFYDPSNMSIIENPAKVLLDSKNDAFILKPGESRGGGQGVQLVNFIKGEIIVNGKNVSLSDFNDFLAKLENYIAVDYIKQNQYAKEMYPRTSNTMRITTVRDDDKILLVDGFHRMGTKTSFPVDNYSSGGIYAAIDLDTGELTYGKTIFDNTHIVYHPDTNFKIEGFKIPNWQGIRETIIGWHSKLIQYDFLAWDVEINEDGKPFVIEINRGSDLNHQQIIPRRNKELGKWMEKRGFLDRR